MPYVEPVSREQLAENEPYFKIVESALGFLPGAYFTMGRRPEILRAFTSLVMSVLGPGKVDMGLKHVVSLMTSVSAGCRYCQAHTAISAQRFGVSDDKVAAVFEFETSDLFTNAERAALRLARDAGTSPNATTPAHFDDLYRYYSAEQIVEIVSSISLFGFLNRWNETMASELEPEPLAYAEATLRASGWEPGKHAPHAVST
jgi:AhpD family alkylhydroperoxidase